MTLFERGDYGLAAMYVALSVAVSIMALAFGLFIARSVWA